MNTRPLGLALLLACVVGGACAAESLQPAGGLGGHDGEDAAVPGKGGKGGGGRGGSSPGGKGGNGEGSGGATAGSGGSGEGGLSGTVDAAEADAAAAPDMNPGGATDADGTPGTLPPAVRKVVILHDVNAGGSANDPSRKSMMDILSSMKDSHGIVVEWMDSPTKAEQLMDKAMVIVGPNGKFFGANHPDPGLKTLPVPLMVSKDGNTSEIGLGQVGATGATFNTISIAKTDHPLAAGFPMGKLTVLTTPAAQRIITFSDLGPDAIKIANGPTGANTWSLIAYEKGGDMGHGLKAPAKRVGLFWHRPAAATADGAKLFKAAVDWALRP